MQDRIETLKYLVMVHVTGKFKRKWYQPISLLDRYAHKVVDIGYFLESETNIAVLEESYRKGLLAGFEKQGLTLEWLTVELMAFSRIG
jgi:hypothetical protein